jgi:hypothetical protein
MTFLVTWLAFRRARPRVHALATLIALIAIVLTLAHPAAAAGIDMLRYTFDQGTKLDAQGRKYVVDVTGRGHSGYVQKANNGGVTVIPGAGGVGKALQFPARCDGSGCPKGLIEAADTPDLNPGAAPFSYGASVLLTQAQLTTGSNIVQKGLFDTPGGQWKLQADNLAGRPSCIVQGMLNGQRTLAKVESTLSITGAWHTITCRKTTSYVAIQVDGVERGRKTIQVGTVSNTTPVRIGAKNLKDDNDQFHGALDNVFFRLD